MRRVFFDYYGWRPGWVAAGITALLMAVVLSLTLGVYFGSRHACDRKTDAMQREGRYGLFEGCLVQTTRGEYVPLDTYRLTDEEAGR